jgi:hypothetical protein
MVAEKHTLENKNRPTDIICKFFLDAVEHKMYGWWVAQGCGALWCAAVRCGALWGAVGRCGALWDLGAEPRAVHQSGLRQAAWRQLALLSRKQQGRPPAEH